MKKFLAVIMSLVMMFSLAVLPVAAAEADLPTDIETSTDADSELDAETEDETVTLDEVFETIELTITLIEDTVRQIHNIVGSILGVLSKECPMCGEIHQISAEEELPGDTEELPEDSEELPEDDSFIIV